MATLAPPPVAMPPFLNGGGRNAGRIAAHDWSATAIGPLEVWPQSLKTTVALMLRSDVPMVLLWGPLGVMIYNDAYSVFAGGRDGRLLGSNVREGWEEVADFNDNVMRVGLAGGTLHYKDQELTLHRDGVPEQVWMDLDYSPVLDESGMPAGVLAIVIETTQRVKAERWLAGEHERLRAMFEQAPAFMALLAGPEHRFEFANAPYRKLVGNREVVGKTVAEALPDAAAQGYVDVLDRVFETGEAYRASGARFVAQPTPESIPDERRLDFVYQALRGADGNVIGILVDGVDVTDRYRAEALLERSQEAGGVGLFSIDIDSNIISGTPQFFRIFGYEPRSTIESSEIERLIHPDDSELISNAARRVTGTAPLNVEYRIRRADTGEERYIARNGEYERDEQGRPVRLIGAVLDATERHRTERELEKVEAGFRALAQSLPNQVWTARTDGTLDWFNARTYDYSGGEEGKSGRHWTEIVHPDDVEDSSARWSHAVTTGEIYENEFRLQNRSGEYRWFLSRAMPIRDVRGVVTQWVGTNTDIHEQKLAEVQNAQDRDRLWTMSRDLMLVVDFSGTITAVNPTAERMLGWSDADLHGVQIADFVHPDDLEGTIAEIAQLADGRTTLAFENRFRTRAGDYRLLSWTAVPEAERIHAVGRDITHQRAVEEALRQAQKMEAVGQLTGGIAHDFNNLLQGITGSLDVMQSRIAKGRTDDLGRWLDGAKTSAARAAALTHRLLAFSRRQPLDPRPVRANPLIASIEDMLRRTLGERVALDLKLADELWLTRCDPNQLESAILNLAINARDAMPDGGTLTIETSNAELGSFHASRESDLKPGQYVCVSVADTGTGMSRETIERAFDPFFTTKPIGQGTGLGLSMVYGFARQSEGYTRIQSEVGEGTAIRIYLPRHRGEEDPEDLTPDAQGARASDAGETVLVIEDEPVVRGLILEVLSDLGYRAIEAADGPRGLEILQSKRRIDLLITDIGLPGLNGRQVADAARVGRPELKVLFMTGYAENAALASGFLDPGMAMITKPFAMDALAARIREIIEV